MTWRIRFKFIGKFKYLMFLREYMDKAIFVRNYESLSMQIEIDYNNLKTSFEKFKNNSSDQKLFAELCRNYAFLCQDIKYFEKIKENISRFEKPILMRFLDYLREIKALLKDVKEIFLKKLT